MNNEKLSRCNLIDIIKGIMILFIIITHYKWDYPSDYLKYGFVFYIDMAVPVFMIISGYLAAKSLEKKGHTLQQAFSLDVVLPKLLRFLIPFLITFIIELPFLIIYKKSGILSLIQIFVGGVGPGSYYTPVMLQFIFIAPVIYFIIKRYDFCGMCACFLFTALWEAVQYSWGMNDRPYALLVLRYVSVIAFGCYIAIGQIKLNKKLLYMMFVTGIVWQCLLCYVPLNPPFMNLPWARVNYLSSLIVMPIMYVLIRKFYASSFKIPVIQQLGKASYNIFLVQMVYYSGASLVYKKIHGTLLQIAISVITCCCLGYIFYKIETKITRYVVNGVRKRNYYKDKINSIKIFCNRIAGSN